MVFFGEKFIKELDLFSRPFAFFVGSQKSRTTFVGGFLSLSIICVSVVYFYYLMDLYFTNKVEPKITSSMKIENDMKDIQISDGFFMLEMLIKGQPLKQYEKEVGKVFLNYNVYYEQYYKNGTSNYTNLKLSECSDPQFSQYQCVDQSNFQQNLDIYNSPIQNVSSDYSIQVSLCDNSTTSNCATLDEIQETIFQPSNYFLIYTKIRQYDSGERKYKESYKSEYFFFDPNMITYTRIDLVASTTKVTEGLLIQSTQIQDNIFDYERIDTYFSLDRIEERMNISGLAYIVFELNQARNYINIQHPMVTEVLAQFMSIFNSLLTIGILARLLAESYIVEDMNNILLKEYYKKTALRLVQRKEIKKALAKFGKADAAGKAQIMSNLNIIGQVPSSLRETSAEKEKSKIIVEVQKKISETNFSEQQKQYFSLSVFERIKLFFKKIAGHGQKTESKKDQNSDPILYNNLLKQSMKRINIFEVYKDLIKMKMAIKLMLTKDQYAAIQFCGSDICKDTKFQTDQDNQNNQAKIQDKQNQQTEQINQKNLLALNQSKKTKNLMTYPQCKTNSKVQSSFFKQKKKKDSRDEKENDFFKQKFPSIEVIKESNNEENKNTQSQNQIVLDKQLDQKESTLSGVISSDQIQKNGKESNFYTSRNLISQINSENVFNLISPTKFNQHLQERDNIQSLKINGDQMDICAISILSLDSLSEENQNDKEQNQIQTNNVQVQFLQLKSHLDEMDLIEENEEEQEKYLKEFLIKMKDQKNLINDVDKHIYQSLIINEQQVKTIENQSNLLNLQNRTEKILSIDQPRLSQILIDLQKNQIKNN